MLSKRRWVIDSYRRQMVFSGRSTCSLRQHDSAALRSKCRFACERPSVPTRMLFLSRLIGGGGGIGRGRDLTARGKGFRAMTRFLRRHMHGRGRGRGRRIASLPSSLVLLRGRYVRWALHPLAVFARGVCVLLSDNRIAPRAHAFVVIRLRLVGIRKTR